MIQPKLFCVGVVKSVNSGILLHLDGGVKEVLNGIGGAHIELNCAF